MSILGLSPQQFSSMMATIMDADDILPGSQPSYEVCKAIYLYHPLGAKIAEGPIKLAQTQEREVKVAAAPEEVTEAFEDEFRALGVTRLIRNIHTQSRVYGMTSVVLLAEGIAPDQPIPPDELWNKRLAFNVVDPLNTSGLIVDQNPNSLTFQKHGDVRVAGTPYHRSRTFTVMNEEPIYLAWTGSAFSYAGRSCYQRALYPLKTFLESMRTDNLVVRKSGVIIAKMRQPGSIVDQMMQRFYAIKRQLVHEAKTDGVLSIAVDEAIETLNMQNLDGAYSLARENTIKNVAVAVPMPAKMLTQEAYVYGFGEGTQDAAELAQHADGVRLEVEPLYRFFDQIVQHRAWNPEWYEREIQSRYSDAYGQMPYAEAFYRWRKSFEASWPNVLKEPESELVKVDEVRLRATIAIVQVISPLVDPGNKASLVDWAVDQFNSREVLFQGGKLQFDQQAIEEFLEEEMDRQQTMAEGGMGEGGDTGLAQEERSGKPPRPFASLDANDVVTDLMAELKRRGR